MCLVDVQYRFILMTDSNNTFGWKLKSAAPLGPFQAWAFPVSVMLYQDRGKDLSDMMFSAAELYGDPLFGSASGRKRKAEPEIEECERLCLFAAIQACYRAYLRRDGHETRLRIEEIREIPELTDDMIRCFMRWEDEPSTGIFADEINACKEEIRNRMQLELDHLPSGDGQDTIVHVIDYYLDMAIAVEGRDLMRYYKSLVGKEKIHGCLSKISIGVPDTCKPEVDFALKMTPLVIPLDSTQGHFALIGDYHRWNRTVKSYGIYSFVIAAFAWRDVARCFRGHAAAEFLYTAYS